MNVMYKTDVATNMMFEIKFFIVFVISYLFINYDAIILHLSIQNTFVLKFNKYLTNKKPRQLIYKADGENK